MLYLIYRNKDVIYIEPENDITDIIAKIENEEGLDHIEEIAREKAGIIKSSGFFDA